ncbi:hypothetical protein K7G98_13735 [Saccharothrix sp. MB29]|nr:hypothetical protein [Saccharothrix sp. MB29]
MVELADSVESVEQLASVWRDVVLDRDPDADVRDLPGIAVRWADCRFAFWNCVTLTDVGADADLLGRRLGEAADVMRSKRHPGFLWLFEDLLTDDARAALDGAAGRAGLVHAFPGTGMAWDVPSTAEPAHPDRFQRRPQGAGHVVRGRSRRRPGGHDGRHVRRPVGVERDHGGGPPVGGGRHEQVRRLRGARPLQLPPQALAWPSRSTTNRLSPIGRSTPDCQSSGGR